MSVSFFTNWLLVHYFDVEFNQLNAPKKELFPCFMMYQQVVAFFFGQFFPFQYFVGARARARPSGAVNSDTVLGHEHLSEQAFVSARSFFPCFPAIQSTKLRWTPHFSLLTVALIVKNAFRDILLLLSPIETSSVVL